MQTLALRRGESRASIVEKPRPEPGPGEALVRTLRVGIDGTDREILAGEHGGFPDGEDHLVLGHEAVGVVEASNDPALELGTVVAPTVRRPPNGGNEYFERGEEDTAPPELYHERGIDGAHGFAAEYFTSPASFLVEVPRELAELGFLVEPLSVTEKALEIARTSRSSFDWTPESALVLGNGSLGLLTLAVLRDRLDRVYCLGRRDRPDPTIRLIEALDATYVDSRETSVSAVAETHEPVDLVYEATGYARHGIECVHALAHNGVAALLGVPRSWSFEVDGGAFHEQLVLGNRALVGSVNANAGHFRRAVDALASLPEWVLDDLVTGVYGLDDYERAFADDDSTIKTAVELSTV
ncbi:glucose 1-dehydrogenase [Halobaculum sp. MBLA0147]|uniref:glucose 1-dehydrogenase n=1 Tax=Halobaculum sp. MBLA0147 TaxID=3079934 RepID=UPI0035237CBB